MPATVTLPAVNPIHVAAHPLLRAAAFETTFPSRLADVASPAWLVDLLRIDAPAPLVRDEAVRGRIRDLLRSGGYKPTGRGKPASEYLVRAAGDGSLISINPAVDVCNAVSLHGGLPISVIDVDRAAPPLRIAIAPAGQRYVFNAAGQEIDLEGLLCLHDAAGPCANAVRDAQRTKTRDSTMHTLSVIWGTAELGAHVDASVRWYRELLERTGAITRHVALIAEPHGSPAGGST